MILVNVPVLSRDLSNKTDRKSLARQNFLRTQRHTSKSKRGATVVR